MENEIGDYELETGEPGIEVEEEHYPDRPPERTTLWIVVAVVAAVLIAVMLFFYFRSEPELDTVAETPTAEAPSVEAPTPALDEPAEPQLELPELTASDAFIRDLTSALSSRPELAKWLATDDLIRRFVAAVDNVAEGVSPRPHLLVMAPEGDFEVVDLGGGRVVIDPRSYNRYNMLAAVIGSLDAQGSARLLENLEPLFDEAYRELGYPGGSFRATFQKAIRAFLTVPVLDDDAIRLDPGVSAFKFSQSHLEDLTSAQKQLIRTGPDNTRIIQAKIREVQAAFAK